MHLRGILGLKDLIPGASVKGQNQILYHCKVISLFQRVSLVMHGEILDVSSGYPGVEGPDSGSKFEGST